MGKRKKLVSIMICICMVLTACGGVATEKDDNAAGGVSGSAVSGAAVSDATDKTVPPEELPDEWMAKGYLMDVTFRIKEKNPQGYRATVEIDTSMWDMINYPAWEICLDLEDEIIELSGAEIVSREGMRYTIRGVGDNRDFTEDDDVLLFDIAVQCPDGAHEPGICYWRRECVDVQKKAYKVEILELVEEGTAVHGMMRLTNCSEKDFDYWKMKLETNFEIESIRGARLFHEDVWEDEAMFDICGEGEKLSLKKGESVEISFTGKSLKKKPKMDKNDILYVDTWRDTRIDWGIMEQAYGAKYGEIEKYLVADTVSGVDLFFVFDEKGNDSYTATAELTNILLENDIQKPKYYDYVDMLEISDWEIYLECEDTIEEIEGAEITAHEGNVYYICAADKNKWIPCYGMDTFQVKVSCEGQIHHLGKVYLKKARYRGEELSSGDRQQELEIKEEDISSATGCRWITYHDLYGGGVDGECEYDIDDFETSQAYEAYKERVKWGKKMGR